jgi:hypothetical protein
VIRSDEDARLLARARAWDGPESDLTALSAERLTALARTEGLEFATALLYDRLSNRPENADFMARAERWDRSTPFDANLIGIVPGAFHREHHDTGADGARVLAIARELGCEAEVIPILDFGTLGENAAIITRWLADRRGRRIALIALSKGAADAKYALSLPESREHWANVRAWINFSGLTQGTPLVAQLRRQWWRWCAIRLMIWWHGYRVQAARELAHGPGTPLHAWPALPPHLRLVHVHGVPLERHLVHRWAPRGYQRLAPLGPNDGGSILLADLAKLPGLVCPIWGMDHYLVPNGWDPHPLFRAIVACALASDAPRQASQSAPQPMAPPATRSRA